MTNDEKLIEYTYKKEDFKCTKELEENKMNEAYDEFIIGVSYDKHFKGGLLFRHDGKKYKLFMLSKYDALYDDFHSLKSNSFIDKDEAMKAVKSKLSLMHNVSDIKVESAQKNEVYDKFGYVNESIEYVDVTKELKEEKMDIFEITRAETDENHRPLGKKTLDDYLSGKYGDVELVLEGKLNGKMTLITMTDIQNEFKEIKVISLSGKEFRFSNIGDKEMTENFEPVYHFSIPDLEIKGTDFDNAEEAYEEAVERLSKLGYEVGALNDDAEFEILSPRTGVAYSGTIYGYNPGEMSESKQLIKELKSVLSEEIAQNISHKLLKDDMAESELEDEFDKENSRKLAVYQKAYESLEELQDLLEEGIDPATGKLDEETNQFFDKLTDMISEIHSRSLGFEG